MSVRDRWAQSGILAFRLPSGFIVSGVWPSLSELTRRGQMPWSLRTAIWKNTGKKVEELSAEDVGRNVEQRLRVAAAFLTGIYDDEAGEWEPLRVTFEELTDGTFPGDDIEALDAFVISARMLTPELAAWTTNIASEDALGLYGNMPEEDDDKGDSPEKPKEEAGDTVDDWARFRDEHGGAAPGEERQDVGPAPVVDGADNGPVDSPRRRRRTGAAPRARRGQASGAR